jgi:putative chitinase
MNLTAAQLRAVMTHCPDERAEFFRPYLVMAMAEFGIVKAPAIAAFLAQVAHESGELARLVENLNYSAAGLRKTWPSRFRDRATAERYARRPMAIANRVYASRLGNGDEQSGDGWRYRGRGLFQVTGRANYREAGAALALPLELEPELLEHPGPACRSAGWYWRSRGLGMVIDAGEAVADLNGPLEAYTAVTRRINGGLTGLPERLVYWHRARRALAVAA